ncbi:hypothetical protein C8T65DRAFT_834324 [Cerioporus squamosus]|nr:hypothetical protein C8T65DRAFT_834324 [Cerioporus squamosus]
MYELKLGRLTMSSLASMGPQTVLLAVVLMLTTSLMTYYAFHSVSHLRHSFNAYLHSCARSRSMLRSPKAPITHYIKSSESNAYSASSDRVRLPSENDAPTIASDHATPPEGEVPSILESESTLECFRHDDAEAARSVESDEPTPEPSMTPHADSPDSSAAPHSLATEAASTSNAVNLVPEDDTPASQPEAGETNSEELKLLPSSPQRLDRDIVERTESAQAVAASTAPGILLEDVAELPEPPVSPTHPPIETDAHGQVLGSCPEAFRHPPELVVSSVDVRDAPVGPMAAHKPPASPVASSALADEEVEPEPEADPEYASDSIMQSALLVDVHGDGDGEQSPSPLPCAHSCDAEDDDEDGDTEWTSVDHTDGRTPRAATPVDASPAAFSSLSRDAAESFLQADYAPTLMAPISALKGSTVLLTESEYLHLGVMSMSTSTGPQVESDAEEADSCGPVSPSESGSAGRAHRHTPSHLEFRTECPSQRSVGSPTQSESPATPGGTRVHTPDRPDWAVAPQAGDQDQDGPASKPRRHSYEHPDWAVAPGPLDTNSEGATVKRKGRQSDSVAGGTGRSGRGKRRTRRGRHSR